MNKNSTLLLFILVPVIFSSCSKKAFYLSPFNGKATTYYAKPLLADSAKSAIYLSAEFTASSENDEYIIYDDNIDNKALSDNLYSVQFSFHRSHTSKYFQAYYGATLTTGKYEVTKYDSANYHSNYAHADMSNVKTGNKYFGGAGIVGGINLLMPLNKGSEWRVIGIETSIGNEWGDYLDFRKSLPDSSASAITRGSHYGYAGLTTELVFKKRKGNTFGMKMALGSSLFKTLELGLSEKRETYLVPLYFTFTAQYSRPKYTVYTQFNHTEHAIGIQFGASYKLSKVHHR
jgi:hypothetical protein